MGGRVDTQAFAPGVLRYSDTMRVNVGAARELPASRCKTFLNCSDTNEIEKDMVIAFTGLISGMLKVSQDCCRGM